ncbi:MAG: hypothetical protein HQ518_21010 [Rhodopirellula sp.]|nr:hypothetical protein [Rhodopirellula sp.]
MASVNVLVAVDVEGALTSGNLEANTYMVDTNKYAGSGFEGTAELMTTLGTGDVIIWSVAPIDPGTNIKITGFSGQAVTDNYINPVPDPLSAGVWESRFQPPGGAGSGATYQYTLSFSLEGKAMTFDPFLVVK